VKNFLLIANLNLLCLSVKPFPIVLSLFALPASLSCDHCLSWRHPKSWVFEDDSCKGFPSSCYALPISRAQRDREQFAVPLSQICFSPDWSQWGFVNVLFRGCFTEQKIDVRIVLSHEVEALYSNYYRYAKLQILYDKLPKPNAPFLRS